MEIEHTEQTEQVSEGPAAEEVWARIADRVRTDSQTLVQLTPVDSLAELLPELDADTIQAHLAGIAQAEAYGDIQSINAATGTAFLYSERGMTGKYAEILARIEGHDPCATIAETVRNDSKIYPRPTNVSVFKQPPFRMADDELAVYLPRVLEIYEDIKSIQASTGAVYLHSERYMKSELAKSHVRWLEVEQYQNP